MVAKKSGWLVVGVVLLISAGFLVALAPGSVAGLSIPGVGQTKMVATGSSLRNCDLVLNFDSINTSPSGSASATSYLASNGVTISGATAGTSIVALNSEIAYGGQGFVASSLPNVLTQTGSNAPVVFTLNFAAPLSSVSFVRPFLIAGPSGQVFPEWKATAYNGTTSVATHGQALISSYTNVSAVKFTFSGSSDINSLTIHSNSYGYAGYSAVLIDNLTLTSPALCRSGATFSEKGLTGLFVWNVVVTGTSGPALAWFVAMYPMGLTLSSMGTTITFELPSGTYSWSVNSIAGTPTVGSGSLTISYPTATSVSTTWT
jgi:hypothetical protein